MRTSSVSNGRFDNFPMPPDLDVFEVGDVGGGFPSPPGYHHAAAYDQAGRPVRGGMPPQVLQQHRGMQHPGRIGAHAPGRPWAPHADAQRMGLNVNMWG